MYVVPVSETNNIYIYIYIATELYFASEYFTQLTLSSHHS